MVGQLQAATQNQFLRTITFLHGGFKAVSKRKKKVSWCVQYTMQMTQGQGYETFALLPYVLLQYSRAR